MSGDWAGWRWRRGFGVVTQSYQRADRKTAPELFFSEIPSRGNAAHPLLERMTPGDRRTTFGLRQSL